METESMKASLAASKRLIDMEARGEIDKVARNAKNEGKMLYDEEGYVTPNLTENKHQQQAPKSFFHRNAPFDKIGFFCFISYHRIPVFSSKERAYCPQEMMTWT